jgi:hypothetical protein
MHESNSRWIQLIALVRPKFLSRASFIDAVQVLSSDHQHRLRSSLLTVSTTRQDIGI